MHQFLYGNDAAFAYLEQRARITCKVFPNQELPPGSWPVRARVGFGVDPRNNVAVLLVDRGISYIGTHQGVREWLAAGEKTFPDFRALVDWIRQDLASAYRVVPDLAVPDLPPAESRLPATSRPEGSN